MSSSARRLAALAAVLALAGVALALAGDGFAAPTEERPWPYAGGDAHRTYNAGQAETAVDPTAFNASHEFGAQDGEDFYVSASAADLTSDPDPEVVTTLYGFLGGGGLVAYEPNGTQLWGASVPNPSLPTIADFDGDGAQEIHVAAGDDDQRLYEPDGTLAWEAETPEPYDNEALATHSLALDVTGDGVRDVVTHAAMPFPNQSTVSRVVDGDADAAVLLGYDGRTGERLFADEVCGHRLTALVGLQAGGEPLVAAGCEEGPGKPGAGAIEGLRIEGKEDGPIEPLLEAAGGGAATDDDYRVTEAWRTPIEGTGPEVMHTVGADVHPHPGTEAVAFWYNDTGSGLTAVDPATGDVVAEGFDDALDEGTQTSSAGVGDLDGDGHAEIVWAPSPNDRMIAYSLASGDLTRHWTLPKAGEELDTGKYGPDGVSLADHDRDGSPELWTDWQRGLSDERSEEHVGGQHRVYDADGDLLWNKTLTNDPDENQQPPIPIRYHAVADLDGDGTLEQIQPETASVAVYDAPRSGAGG